MPGRFASVIRDGPLPPLARRPSCRCAPGLAARAQRPVFRGGSGNRAAARPNRRGIVGRSERVAQAPARRARTGTELSVEVKVLLAAEKLTSGWSVAAPAKRLIPACLALGLLLLLAPA